VDSGPGRELKEMKVTVGNGAKTRRLMFGPVLGVSLLAVACAATSVALPPDTKVETPASSVPREQAAFAGKWQGVWDGKLPHILVVERITPEGVDVIYATGHSMEWRMSPSWTRAKGKFVDTRTLAVTLSRPATATYVMQPDGTIDATYEWAGPRAKARLERVKE
jgi:hypothetical protein